MSTMTMVEVKCQTCPEMTLHLFQTFANPLASELCSMSSGVTFSATRPGYWSPANDAPLWLRAIFISTNENRMAWKMWKFEQFYWVTASHHPSAVWVLGDLLGYHSLQKACHLPVRWPKHHPRSNSQNGFSFIWNYVYIVFQSSHLLVENVTSSATVETLNTQTSFISVSSSFLTSWKHEQDLRSQNKPGSSSFLEMMCIKSTNNNPPPFNSFSPRSQIWSN